MVENIVTMLAENSAHTANIATNKQKVQMMTTKVTVTIMKLNERKVDTLVMGMAKQAMDMEKLMMTMTMKMTMTTIISVTASAIEKTTERKTKGT